MWDFHGLWMLFCLVGTIGNSANVHIDVACSFRDDERAYDLFPRQQSWETCESSQIVYLGTFPQVTGLESHGMEKWGRSAFLKSFPGEPQSHFQQQPKVKRCCFHLHSLSQMCLKYGNDIIKFLQSVFCLLFTRPGWCDLICALRGHNKLLAGQFAESRGWLCLVPVSRN